VTCKNGITQPCPKEAQADVDFYCETTTYLLLLATKSIHMPPPVMWKSMARLAAAILLAHGAAVKADYTPPASSADVLKGVKLNGIPVGLKYRERFKECDLGDTCNKVPLRYGCRADPNSNSVLNRLKDDVIFFDAKMGLDTDGAPLKESEPTHQSETSLKYQIPGDISINSDRVPFIVIPLGGFDNDTGVRLGDIAAVIYKNKKVYAVVADQGPKCKIGEGSIQLHEMLGHKVCKSRDSQGNCTSIRDVGIGKDVLYFIFPGTRDELFSDRNGEPLNPSNINRRLQDIGGRLWNSFIAP
jgi:hypothetical protein